MKIHKNNLAYITMTHSLLGRSHSERMRQAVLTQPVKTGQNGDGMKMKMKSLQAGHRAQLNWDTYY